MAMIEPTPRHSSNRPRVPSLSSARALAYGTNGAQAAMPKPAMKKAMRVDICSSRPGTTGAGVGMAVMENPWFCVQRTMSGTTSLHIKPDRASQVHAAFALAAGFIFASTERSGHWLPPRGHRRVGGGLEGA